MAEQERQVIHLQIDDKHEYYGSMSAIYDHHEKDDIGISYGALRNYRLSPEKPYQNEKKGVVIRMGVLVSKKGNRGRKADNSLDGMDDVVTT